MSSIQRSYTEELMEYVRLEADEIMAEYPDASPDDLADGLERTKNAYDGGVEMARAVVAELRRRATIKSTVVAFRPKGTV